MLYKQLYRIILNSEDATTKTTTTKLINTVNASVVTKYFFQLNIELPFTTHARLAVKSFFTNNIASANPTQKPYSIGIISSPTISQRNTYQSNSTSEGVILLHHNFISSSSTSYENSNYDLNYIDIQNNTSWLTNGIELVVHSRISDDGGNDIGGFPEIDEWSLELLIYDEELEKNPKLKPFIPYENTYAPVYG
jgi:hypothetical protein